MKSFRRQGTEVCEDATRKFSSEPWKYSSSVRTDKAVAPAPASSFANSVTLKSPRIKPFDGDAFFNSAMIAGPVALAVASALRNPRGRCASALFSRSRKSAVERHSATLRRVAAIISARTVMLNLLIIRESVEALCYGVSQEQRVQKR